MRISSLAKLIGGELLNHTITEQIEGFCFNSSKATRQNAYFALHGDLLDMRAAVQNGAYCIITDLDITPFDNEIAFIKVVDLRLSIYRLARYYATQKELRFASINVLDFDILKHISGDFTLLSGDFGEIFRVIEKSPRHGLIFSNDFALLEKISFEPLNIAPKKADIIKQNSLFFSDFEFNAARYSLQFPRFFIDELCGVLGFLQEQGVSFKLKDFKDFAHFRALFVDFQNTPTSFGASQKAFICESDEHIFSTFCASLKGKMALCAPLHRGLKCADISFASLGELKKLRNFTYALVLCEYDELYGALNTKEQGEFLF